MPKVYEIRIDFFIMIYLIKYPCNRKTSRVKEKNDTEDQKSEGMKVQRKGSVIRREKERETDCEREVEWTKREAKKKGIKNNVANLKKWTALVAVYCNN